MSEPSPRAALIERRAKARARTRPLPTAEASAWASAAPTRPATAERASPYQLPRSAEPNRRLVSRDFHERNPISPAAAAGQPARSQITRARNPRLSRLCTIAAGSRSVPETVAALPARSTSAVSTPAAVRSVCPTLARSQAHDIPERTARHAGGLFVVRGLVLIAVHTLLALRAAARNRGSCRIQPGSTEGDIEEHGLPVQAQKRVESPAAGRVAARPSPRQDQHTRKPGRCGRPASGTASAVVRR